MIANTIVKSVLSVAAVATTQLAVTAGLSELAKKYAPAFNEEKLDLSTIQGKKDLVKNIVYAGIMVFVIPITAAVVGAAVGATVFDLFETSNEPVELLDESIYDVES